MDDQLFSYADPTFPRLKRSIIRMIEKATGQPELKRLYNDHVNNPVAGESFFHSAVRRMALDILYDPAALAAIPKTGPLVVVANHPYGVLDGIVISWLMEKVRPDFKVLTNAVLLRAPDVKPYLLPVDFAGTPEAMATNISTRDIARKHLDAGGCVVVFPAGGVSTAPDRLGRRPAVDAPWQPFTSQLIQRSKANVVPIYFSGQNSRLFQIASHIHSALRLSLIFKEVRDRIGTTLPIAIGRPLAFADIAAFGDRKAMIEELCRRTYALASGLPDHDPRHTRRTKRAVRLMRGLKRGVLRPVKSAAAHIRARKELLQKR